MKKRTTGASRSLTIYLLKEDGSDPYYYIKLDPLAKEYILLVEEDEPWSLFVKRAPPKLPPWASFFTDYVNPEELGRANSTAAALFIPAVGRWWAVTFGQGRHLLREDVYEERFGLRVALNSVGEEKLRSIDKETFDAVAGHARQQASKEVAAREFGLDIERDLLCSVTGSPGDERLGQRISGRDSLSSSLRIELPDLSRFLERLCSAYLDDTYKERFPWVDNIYEVKEAVLRSALNGKLIDQLKARNFENTWLAPPEILDWAAVRFFAYSDASTAPELHDIHWKTFFDLSVRDPEEVDLEFLRRRRVFCVGEDHVTLERWSVYRCIYAEIEHEGGTYLLSSGKWYRVAEAFVEDVNNSISLIPVLDGDLPEFNDESEEDYNARVAAEAPGEYALVDQRLVQYGGGRSKIEFCDLLRRNGDIIHVKRYSGSRDLSHLFAQGLNSGELYQLDEGFRSVVNQVLPQEFQRPSVNERPAAGELRVIFAIISQSRQPLNLPFFSKLSLRHAARRLQGYGYRIALAKVDVEIAKSLLKVSRPQARNPRR